jgi:hypothetical protein
MNGIRITLILINGVEPSWSNVKINIGGVLVTGITAISYKDKQVIDPVYGIGQTVIAVGYENISCTGTDKHLETSAQRRI